MDNASDALKMAFAVFAFVIALSLALTSFTKAKETADTVLWYSDETNYYQWTTGENQEEGRIVGKDTIISSLYNQQADTYVIVILGNEKYIFNYNGKVTEITAIGEKIIDTNERKNMDYLKNFINDKLNKNKTYLENISEVTNEGMLGGEYYIADDGTKITITPGEGKVYITYKEK